MFANDLVDGTGGSAIATQKRNETANIALID